MGRAEFLDAKTLDFTSRGEEFCMVRRESKYTFDVGFWHEFYATANAARCCVNWQDDLHWRDWYVKSLRKPKAK
jgi:hypothetical protein